MTSGFPWKRSRCVRCGKLAIDTDRDNQPICGRHIDFQSLFDRELMRITEIVGKDERNIWIDRQWPGEDNAVKIIPQEGFERARIYYTELRKEISTLARDACICRGNIYSYREPCPACIIIAHWRYPEKQD